MVQSHERDLAEKDVLINMWKQRFDGIQKTLSDERTNNQRLANLLGFDSIGDALLFVETENSSQYTKYRDCLERNALVEAELRKAKEAHNGDREALDSEVQTLRRELNGRSQHIERVEAEKRLLEDKFDDLERTFKQAQAKHLKDDEKFTNWKRWFWSELEEDQQLDRNGRMKKWAARFIHRQDKLAQQGHAVFDKLPSEVDSEVVPKSEPESPVKLPAPRTPSRSRQTSAIPPSSPLTPTTKNNCPSSGTIRAQSTPPSHKRHVAKFLHEDPRSSDNEDDHPNLASSQTSGSVTEDDSQPLFANLSAPQRKVPASPAHSQLRYLKRTQPAKASERPSERDSQSSPIRGHEHERTRKRRRLSDGAQASSMMSGLGVRKGKEKEVFTDDEQWEEDTRRRKPSPLVWSPSQIRMPPPPLHASTPAVMAAKKKLDDYSAYKGRGRYAPATAPYVSTFFSLMFSAVTKVVFTRNSVDKTLNQAFVVNADLNQGLDYQFEEVVRGRENRKRLAAGDCEECRDYYEAIGPMPPRLKQPLWRSPVTSPVKANKVVSCHHNHTHSHQKGRAATPPSPSPNRQIESHKQDISRHRYQWERAKTPPGYWNIGFPDTQEAQDINERAKELHRKKWNAIESEAARENGRYRRR
ncbi:hypothetical protein V5O48_000743 [Marasmius crinis-equi]|uniref:DNA endonuclease activator Ctp1 C-terminal domain-containing protein n=1 Tax=Marasmius crinis-equi TaxID=585013 RepID=A0ABR3G0S8_9AGAR